MDLVDIKGLIVQISLDEKMISTSDLEKLSSVGNHIITINYGSLSCDYSIHLVDVNEEYDITFIDIDETIRSERDIVDYCIYGGWINKEFVEVLGKEEALPIFEDLIPFILREEMILCG